MPFVSIGTATIQRNFSPNFVVSTTQDLNIRGVFSAENLSIPVIQNELTDPVNDILLSVNTLTETIINQNVFWS
jgi:hypothetical protein